MRNPNTEPLNLWGFPGCQRTEIGDLCNLCCFALVVQALNKAQEHECEHQDEQRGCEIHGNHPEECRQFHCSQQSQNMWYWMYHVAYQRGLITLEERNKLRKKLIIT
jgi:hypothetical protein